MSNRNTHLFVKTLYYYYNEPHGTLKYSLFSYGKYASNYGITYGIQLVFIRFFSLTLIKITLYSHRLQTIRFSYEINSCTHFK